MIAWLAANAATIIVAAVLAVIVFFLIRAVATDKVGCGGDCAHCGSHAQPSGEAQDSPCAHCAGQCHHGN